jgi:alpha-glucosidase (family GH31 glycosyl hydrolase)
MKQLILITGMLLAMTVKLVAQENKGIEVKGFQTQNTELQKENHQFEIVAHEEVDVNLNFTLKTEDNINIIVTDKKNKTILTDKFKKAGQNKLSFTMEENEKYLVKLIGEKQSNLIVQVSED